VAHADAEFENDLAEAVRLYEELEYEQALVWLERASKASHDTKEEVARLLYKGLISADMGRWAVARAAFRSALQHDPEARLPLRTSPKVVAAFESQQAKVQAERARMGTEPSVLATARPSTVGPGQVEVPPSDSQALVDRSELVPIHPEEDSRLLVAESSWTRRVPRVSMVLLGLGVAAGGVGTYYGLSSQRRLSEARGAQFLDEATRRHAQARRGATRANILFGTAGLAAAGAVVTWLFMGDAGADDVRD